jgi:ADP-L-glycero-D-manno-heptose 6-epimerase
MRILVTGGTGFIGSNIALELERLGHDVMVTGSMYEQPLPGFKGKILYMGVLGIDWSQIGEIDAVLHQGAISNTRIYDREEMMRANLETSKEIFSYALAHGAHHIVYASSTAVYGDLPAPYIESGPVAPLNPYAESKAALDAFAMEFAREHPEVKVVGLRYCNVYGPGENHKGKSSTMIYQFAQQMQKGNPQLFAYGEQKRDYIYVKDVVRANLLGLEAKESCVVNCGTGTPVSFNDIVALLNKSLGVSRAPEYIENPYGKEYQSHTQCDMSLAKEKLGFIPSFSIEDGISDYAESGFLFKKD